MKRLCHEIFTLLFFILYSTFDTFFVDSEKRYAKSKSSEGPCNGVK